MRVQIILFHGMTLLDMVGPTQVWALLPGAELQYVAAAVGPVQTDCHVTISATHDYASAWRDPDILFIGGAGRPTLDALADADLIAFLANRGARAKWVTSVCTGALMLGAAGLLKGYRANSHWGTRDQLENFGAILSDERVCIDRNRATGGGITSGIDFGLTLAGIIAGDNVGRMLELLLEYNPAPPFGTGHPSIADRETLEHTRALLAAEYAPAS